MESSSKRVWASRSMARKPPNLIISSWLAYTIHHLDHYATLQPFEPFMQKIGSGEREKDKGKEEKRGKESITKQSKQSTRAEKEA
eukprot:1161942-Pelagomonas_calceolata.AAC.4